MLNSMRSRWAAVGAAVAVTLGAGGVHFTQAAVTEGEMPVFVPLDEPCRVADTRPAEGPIGPKGTPIGAGEAEAYEIQITGGSGECTGALAVPDDAAAVALNLTAVAPTANSFFVVYPGDSPLPGTANLNFVAGAAPTPNKVDVGLSADGTIKIFNNAGTAHSVVDVFGYYVDHMHTGEDIVDSSLTRIDILDEAGLVYDHEPAEQSLNFGVTRVAVDTIRIPADGYVVVEATGVYSVNASANSFDFAWCNINKGGTAADVVAEVEGWTILTDFDSDAGITANFTARRVFPVSTADNVGIPTAGAVFGFDCKELSGQVVVRDVLFTATYFSTLRNPPVVVSEL